MLLKFDRENCRTIFKRPILTNTKNILILNQRLIVSNPLGGTYVKPGFSC
jgi:hypothetical protein